MLYKVVVIYAGLVNVEWVGTTDLARRQSSTLDVPRFEVVRARGGDFLGRAAALYNKP
ncbi:hypothetical protein GCM10011583_66240 [Streptomyces camponoticapitis]|uniref:Uncharacterized protein n=1 Tax=Streptomyces camponoticapitis TaxID=1616125 RepID=A0ABQ2EWD6_9ACTN|nr:hypothetical protein [Streptomyces camponoticapitis]GGK24935.1 hypothetical protein GCM10011583_66240 [Streptomyces camponoticapitis]